MASTPNQITAWIVLIGYLNELYYQSCVARKAFSEIETRRPPGKPRPKVLDRADDSLLFRMAVQSLVASSGTVSNLLWPEAPRGANGKKKRSLERGNYLRQILHVDSHPGMTFPLLKDRSLRNSLAHVDERLDEWGDRVMTGPGGMISLPMKTTGVEEMSDGKPVFALGYDSEEYVFRFWEHDINLKALMLEVATVGYQAGELASVWMQDPTNYGPLPPWLSVAGP